MKCIEEAKNNLPRLQDINSTNGDVVAALTDACKYRTTSRLSDETFCLASIAGISLRDIVEVKTHEEKMKLFLLQLKELSPGIVFFTGPRLTLENFRWVPSSFLYPEPSSTIIEAPGGPKAICTEIGLQWQWFGFTLDFPSMSFLQMELYYFRTHEYWVTITSLDYVRKSLHNITPNKERLSLWRTLHEISNSALLIESYLRIQDSGLIVLIEQEGAEMIRARFVLRVNATLVSANTDVFDLNRIDHLKGSQISADSVDHGMKWTLT